MKRELIKRAAIFVFLIMLCACVMPASDQQLHNSPVQLSHITKINSLFKEKGLKEAIVSIDKYGRVILKGSYQDNKEVDKAFSLAQTVVGPKWVSPVTPENIKVSEWIKVTEGWYPGKKTSHSLPATSHSISTKSGNDANDPPGPISAKYAIIVGVSRFQESKINVLKYAQQDAKVFYDYLISSEGGNFRKENIVLMLNQDATKPNISNAFEQIKQKAGKDDLVVLFFSSHGTPPAPFGGVYIVTFDSIINPRESIWESSVSNEMLKDFISGVKSKRLVVIMDTCYSNGAYRQIDGFLPSGGKSLGIEEEEEGAGLSRSFMAEKMLGAKDIILDDEPLQVTKAPASVSGWGRVLFSSSTDGEKSWESDTLRNSFFTYYFVEGLKRYGNVKDAFDYAKPKITEGVLKEKRAQQNPQVAADRKEWNISFK